MEVETSINPDEDLEEEEVLLYLDFQSIIKSDTLQKPNIEIKMIGFETEEPIVQVNNKMFRGVFEHAIGTNVFFTDDPNPPSADPNLVSIPSTMYKYHSKTDKVLKMQRIFITPKNDDEMEEESTETDEDVVPDESYSEALDHFLKPGETAPRVLAGVDVMLPPDIENYFRSKRSENVDEGNEEDALQSEESSNLIETNASEAGGPQPMDVNDVNISQVKIERTEKELK
ncbi:General transcription factor 3C polypeptide 6 [Pseudolycoriella hygida]|uniref:General transcription factor 3C polypeptide 6 n=1 Tax=Pseudolycoriella hygida TaxID=35572 RepID=A0A9Q0RVX1_9DIPT|nr:General transcription factor 3C polypeptide 6 [Pseudolycoriella hygida]